MYRTITALKSISAMSKIYYGNFGTKALWFSGISYPLNIFVAQENLHEATSIDYYRLNKTKIKELEHKYVLGPDVPAKQALIELSVAFRRSSGIIDALDKMLNTKGLSGAVVH